MYDRYKNGIFPFSSFKICIFFCRFHHLADSLEWSQSLCVNFISGSKLKCSTFLYKQFFALFLKVGESKQMNRSVCKVNIRKSEWERCCGVSQIFMICNSDARLRGHSPFKWLSLCIHRMHAVR